MKIKNLIIIITITLIILLGGWFFFGGSGAPTTGGVSPSGSPFGSGSGDSTGTEGGIVVPALNSNFEGQVEALPSADTEAGNALFRLSSAPVAGFVALTRGTSTAVRYVDRATGHIFDATLPGGNGGEIIKTRVTNNTLPQIYEAYFQPNGNAALFRSLDENTEEIKNMALSLTPPRASSTDGLYNVSSTLLRGNLDGISVGALNTLLYVLRDNAAIVSSAFNGDKAKTLWQSSFRNWRTAPLGNNVLVFTKPSARIPGFAYSLTLQGSLKKLAGPLNGLSALGNANGSSIIYSYAENRNMRLFVENVVKGTTSEVVPATLSEKCAWSPKQNNIFFCGVPVDGFSGEEPDNWYRGITHSSDYLWRFDATSQAATLVMQPKDEFGLDLDFSSLALSPDEKYLVFINKTDLSLWAIRLY